MVRVGSSPLGRTGKVASLSTNPDIAEMIATGLAAGILIDAVIVRTLLVPAFVAIMGHLNWWMPDSLARRQPALLIAHRLRRRRVPLA